MKVLFRVEVDMKMYSRGLEFEMFKEEVLKHYINSKIIKEENGKYYGIGLITLSNELEVFDLENKQIMRFPFFEETKAIHFEDMLDSENNAIFAGTSFDAKGGDILIGFDGKTKYKVYMDGYNGVVMSRGEKKLETDLDKRLKIVGIKQ